MSSAGRSCTQEVCNGDAVSDDAAKDRPRLLDNLGEVTREQSTMSSIVNAISATSEGIVEHQESISGNWIGAVAVVVPMG